MKNKTMSNYIPIGLSLILTTLIIYKAFNVQNGRMLSKKKSELVKQTLTQGEQLIIGNTDAPSSLIIYYSYDCKYCRAFFHNNFPEINNTFIKNHKINMVLKPVNLTANAQMAEAYNMLYCLNNIGIFMELHHILLNYHKGVSSPEFIAFQNNLIMENDEMAECISIQEQNAQYLINNKELNALHQKEVPIFIINNRLFKGKISLKEIEKAIHLN